MNKKHIKLAKMIAKWMYLLLKTNEVNKYLYEHTELFEGKYERDFMELLHNEFAKKITRFVKDINNIYLMIDRELILHRLEINEKSKLLKEINKQLRARINTDICFEKTYMPEEMADAMAINYDD